MKSNIETRLPPVRKGRPIVKAAVFRKFSDNHHRDSLDLDSMLPRFGCERQRPGGC